MYCVIGKPRELSELKALDAKPRSNPRSGVSIAVIDDQGFEYHALLEKHDFNIRVFDDIDDIKALSTYPIVICDIKGVGTSFGSKFEGAHIISEVKKYYPDKILIAYSGHQFDPSYNQYFQLCDFVLKKDVDCDEWVENLDAAIRLSLDPIQQWYRLRDYLLSKEVSSYAVFRLEQEYIDSLLSGKSNFPKKRTSEMLSGDIKTVLLNFTSSILFKMLVG